MRKIKSTLLILRFLACMMGEMFARGSFCRLFGGKSGNKQVPVTTVENMKNSTVISNPHATAIQQGNGDADCQSVSNESSSSLYSDSLTVTSRGSGEQGLSSVGTSPGSAFSSWGGRDGVSCLSQSPKHTNMDSMDVSMGREDLCLNRTSSARTGLSDR